MVHFRQKKILSAVLFFLLTFGTANVYADAGTYGGPTDAAMIGIARDVGTFDSFAKLCAAAKCVEDCTQDEAARFSNLNNLAWIWNVANPDNPITIKQGQIGQICEQVNEPPNVQEIEQIYQANGGGHYASLTSGCPCPNGIEVQQNGCSLTFVCKIGGDTDAVLTATTPCPQVMGSDPKYPLAKMLSGTLIEWNGYGSVSEPQVISFGAPNGLSAPGAYYGAEYYVANYTVVLSSIDLGENVKFSTDRANAKKNAKNPLDRSNFAFNLVGGNSYVEVLDQHDIYDAYKARNKYVQAYTVLAGKGYHERPWTSYDKFIDAMCDMSSSKSRCKKELAYYGHRDTEMQGNLYLGNGDMSIIGLYSEVSSHGCHGATVINDKGEPAFGITIKSTWCFYVHAEYQGFVWQLTESKYIGNCCDDWDWVKTGEEERCEFQTTAHERCSTYSIVEWKCVHYQDKYTVKSGWEGMGGMASSSGDCGICSTVTGYLDENGNSTTEPLGISFYQSQPLLIRD